jgi:hypothetical protein
LEQLFTPEKPDRRPTGKGPVCLRNSLYGKELATLSRRLPCEPELRGSREQAQSVRILYQFTKKDNNSSKKTTKFKKI